MKKLILCFLFFLVLVSASCTKKQEKISSQAIPVYNLLKSAKENDVELFKSSYSLKMQKEFMKKNEFRRNWKKILAYMKDVIENGIFGNGGYGDYNLEDFRFKYSGSRDSGIVEIIFKGEADGELDVVLENEEWKVDEY